MRIPNKTGSDKVVRLSPDKSGMVPGQIPLPFRGELSGCPRVAVKA